MKLYPLIFVLLFVRSGSAAELSYISRDATFSILSEKIDRTILSFVFAKDGERSHEVLLASKSISCSLVVKTFDEALWLTRTALKNNGGAITCHGSHSPLEGSEAIFISGTGYSLVDHSLTH